MCVCEHNTRDLRAFVWCGKCCWDVPRFVVYIKVRVDVNEVSLVVRSRCGRHPQIARASHQVKHTYSNFAVHSILAGSFATHNHYHTTQPLDFVNTCVCGMMIIIKTNANLLCTHIASLIHQVYAHNYSRAALKTR